MAEHIQVTIEAWIFASILESECIMTLTHPQTDSRSAIEYFQGKVLVLGVCMALECLVSDL